MKRTTRTATAGTILAALECALAGPAMGVSYVELVPWSTINGSGVSTGHMAHAVEGQTSYHQLVGGFSPRITRVENLNGVQTMTELVSPSAWFDATGEDNQLFTWFGFGVSGDYIQFGDSVTDAIWRVDKQMGAITEYVSKQQIMNHTGGVTVQLLQSSGATPTGEQVFYEGETDNILVTTGPGSVGTLVSTAELIALQGNSEVKGGLAYDANGTLYWGNNTNDAIYSRASDGTLSKVVDGSDIDWTALIGRDPTFNDIMMAPDGLIYWADNNTDDVLRFDPSDPTGTMEIYLTEEHILVGPAGRDNISMLGWYDGNLTFNVFQDSGLYWVPEPATLSLLALGGLLMSRRRR